MNSKVTAVLLISLLLGCKGTGIEPGEVAAMTKGYLFIDNFGNYCSRGGLVTLIDGDSYLAINSVPTEYEGFSTAPLPVWIRYEREKLDTCYIEPNRINILSIRKRE
ncbi:hypothetical protein [Spirosoma endophyticum]|uniref:Lipoprotein n=1 Tax=Spirosoma endophyticum TaxID=662367 RepID=A0A1I2H9W1_9BACT|nr:hypothetical protein [Spirosoma endophyticum]SFF26368.1 hypothetical protein SAMN05216167_13939 [Spirosoma endophyticum]